MSTWLIFGARGYVGRRLTARLRAEGVDVVGADVRALPGESLLVGDVRDASFVARCFSESTPAVVVHLASFGMSGGEMADRATTWAVNEGGTRLVARECARTGAALVYVSTVNVCFNGRSTIAAGDEQMERVAAETHLDAYSASKGVAEKIALEESGGKCVVVRPYGIYGEGEERHFPRMIRMFVWGLYMQIGAPGDRSDWVHVDNLVHAIVLAGRGVDRLAGEAFFIGDGEPCNTIDICRPLWQMVSGSNGEHWWIPGWIMFRLAHVCELIGLPLLSRTEVNKIVGTHWWRTERATQVLGYKPVVSRKEGLERMYGHFRAELEAAGYPEKYHRYRRRVIAIVFFFFLFFVFLLFYTRQ